MLSPEARLLTPKHGRGIARFFTEWSTRGLETQRQLHISRKYTRAFLRRRRGCFERRRWQLQAQRRLRTGGTLCICSVFFAAVRSMAKVAKATFARYSMLSPVPPPLAPHARAIRSLGCSTGTELSTADALQEASKRLSGFGDELFVFLADVLSAIAANSRKILSECAAEPACKQRLTCTSQRSSGKRGASLERAGAAHSPELVLGQRRKNSPRRN